MSQVVVYGTNHCAKCKQLVQACAAKNYAVNYVNVEAGDPLFNELLSHSVKSFPVVALKGEYIFSKSLAEFEEVIQNNQ